MSFLDRLDADERARFEAVSVPLRLDAGNYLMRRGDAGGDIYVLESGSLEAVDHAGGASVVLSVMEAGAVVGEVSYLDASPRSADVRARTVATVRRWAREDLDALVQRDPALAARFWESLAVTMARRLRRATLTTTATATASTGPRLGNEPLSHTLREALLLADGAKERLHDADQALQQRPQDPTAITALTGALDRLEDEVGQLVQAGPPADALTSATRHLRRELRPWLARSRLAASLLRHDDAWAVTPELVEHVLAGVARGEGHTGARIDRWLLDRPSLVSRRAAEIAALDRVRPPDGATGPWRVALLDTPTGTRVRAIADAVGPVPTTLTLVEASREVMTEAIAAAGALPERWTVELLPETPARLALGRHKQELGVQDVILVLDVLTYLPERLAYLLLHHLRSRLVPGGRIVALALDESHDDALLAQVLRWHTIRRSPARLHRLATSVGLVQEASVALDGPGTLVVWSRPSESEL
ncbi:MAG: cyclic nucleotide-binding domain-containing protein [Alphaproteobacteria bacterium]|nr:cyclic nucleotide-binding domain-containing protein [Alphaproteobacteria bacterium]